MKSLKFLTLLASIFAAGSAFAQQAPAQQQQAPAQAAAQTAAASDPVKVNVSADNKGTSISVSADSKDLAFSSGDAIDEIFRRAISSSNAAGMHLAALHSAWAAVKSQVASPHTPSSGPANATFRLEPTVENGISGINHSSTISIGGVTYTINSRTEPGVNGRMLTTGNLVATDANGVASPAAAISLAVDNNGNVTGSVGTNGVAARTPQSLVAEAIVTPTSRAVRGSVSEETIPDNTITTTAQR